MSHSVSTGLDTTYSYSHCWTYHYFYYWAYSYSHCWAYPYSHCWTWTPHDWRLWQLQAVRSQSESGLDCGQELWKYPVHAVWLYRLRHCPVSGVLPPLSLLSPTSVLPPFSLSPHLPVSFLLSLSSPTSVFPPLSPLTYQCPPSFLSPHLPVSSLLSLPSPTSVLPPSLMWSGWCTLWKYYIHIHDNCASTETTRGWGLVWVAALVGLRCLVRMSPSCGWMMKMELRQSTTTSQLTLRYVNMTLVTLSFFSHGKIISIITHTLYKLEWKFTSIYAVHYCYKTRLDSYICKASCSYDAFLSTVYKVCLSLQCRNGVGACPDTVDSRGVCTNDVALVQGWKENGQQCVVFSRNFTSGQTLSLIFLS